MPLPRPKYPQNCSPVPVMMVEPASGAWWEGNSEWGNGFQGNFPPEEGTIVPILNQIQFPGPPRDIAINLFRDDSRTGASGTAGPKNAEVYAQLIYGAGGKSNTIFVDWATGGAFSVACTSLRINAVTFRPIENLPYDATANLLIPPPIPPATVSLAAVVGIEPAASSVPPSFTTQRLVMTGSGVVTFDYPEFARLAIPMVTQLGVALSPVTDFFLRASDAVGHAYTLLDPATSPDLLTQGMNLPGRPGRFQILNQAASGRNAAVKFLLAL